MAAVARTASLTRPCNSIKLVESMQTLPVRLASTEVDEAALDLGVVSDSEPEPASPKEARLLSVTNIIGILDKPGLMPWAVHSALRKVEKDLSAFKGAVTGAALADILNAAKQEPDRIKTAAAGLGTAAHDAIDAVIRAGCFAGNKPRLADAIAIADTHLKDAPVHSKNAVRAFLDWAPRSGLRLDSSGDTMLVWPELGLRGAFDALGWTLDGRAVIIDFKTSSRVHDTFALQLAAYAHLFSNAAAIARQHAAGDETSSVAGLASSAVVVPASDPSIDWGSGIAALEAAASGGTQPAGPTGIAALRPGSEEWLHNIASPESSSLDAEFVNRLLERSCGQVLSFRAEQDHNPATRHARAAMLLRPAKSVHSAVVRLGRYSSSVSEVKVAQDLGACWNGFKAAMFLRRLVGDDESHDAEGGMLVPSRPAGTEANSILHPVIA